MPNDTTEKILYGLFAILLCAGAVLIYKFYTLRGAEQGDIAPIAPSRVTRPKVETIGSRLRDKPAPGTPSLQNGLRATTRKKNPEPQVTHEQRIRAQSKISKQRFSRQSSMKIAWPEHLDYIEADLEDDMKSIYGYNNHTKEALTAVARYGTTTVDQIKDYLKADKDVIPNLNGKKILNISDPQPIRGASFRKGISDIQVVSAKLEGGEQAHFAVVNRKDKKGSYVFIYTAPEGTIEQNDGYVERIYSSIEVLNPKSK